jgi:hypothetical protein
MCAAVLGPSMYVEPIQFLINGPRKRSAGRRSNIVKLITFITNPYCRNFCLQKILYFSYVPLHSACFYVPCGSMP